MVPAEPASAGDARPGRVLVVDGAAFDPGTSAGARATYDLLVALLDLGQDVEFLPLGVKGPADDDELEALRRMGVRAHRAGTVALPALLGSGDFSTVIAHRPGPGAITAAALEGAPDVVGIYWGHDIYARRLAAEARLGGRLSGDARVATLAERRCWSAFDLTVYPTQHEATAVEEAVPGARAVAIPYYLLDGPELPDEVPPRNGRHGLLMVGGAAHAPNRDAVEWLAATILPELLRQDATLEVTVVGEWPAELVRTLERPGLRFAGRVSESELVALHHRSVALVAPLRFGSGARRKLVAAMALGLPVVTTHEGQEGVLVRDGRGWQDGLTIADDADVFAAEALRLMGDDARWGAASARVASAARGVYGRAEFVDAVRSTLSLAAQRHRPS